MTALVIRKDRTPAVLRKLAKAEAGRIRTLCSYPWIPQVNAWARRYDATESPRMLLHLAG